MLKKSVLSSFSDLGTLVKKKKSIDYRQVLEKGKKGQPYFGCYAMAASVGLIGVSSLMGDVQVAEEAVAQEGDGVQKAKNLKNKNQLTTRIRVFFWALYSVPLVCISILLLVPHCVYYCRFVVTLKSGCISPPTLFFFKIVLALQGPLEFHVNFRANSYELTFIFMQGKNLLLEF